MVTATTLVFGTNPSGFGPRLWIGGTDIYFQPSEPLKLLLIVYLSAYFADRISLKNTGANPNKSSRKEYSISFIIPTITLTGLSLIILFIQQDLGTASLFFLLYSIMLYIVTGRKRVLIITSLLLILSAYAGYQLIDVIRTRVDVWINPWTDPSGKAYQIVQSLLAIANGGVIGRGPGLGSPTLVPVAISDFIFTAIAEETGLAGTIGLVLLLNLLIARSFHIALHAQNQFERLLAGGLASYIGLQSLLILGGNLRLSPLTGVNLPFVSYGGSSLLTSFIVVGFLIRISIQRDIEPARLATHVPYTSLNTFISMGLLLVTIATGWWAIIRGPDLLTRTDNSRRSISDRFVRRGSLMDRKNQLINVTNMMENEYLRVYSYDELSTITGYTHPIFGQSGLESTLDSYLRGTRGNPSSLVWWHQLVYGTPPPGLDIRLSIDLDLQRRTDRLLGGHKGAIILLNAGSGEILVMSSHPTFDPNKLGEIGNKLQEDPGKPLINRASQGTYPLYDFLEPLTNARFGTGAISNPDQIAEFYKLLGLYTTPDLYLPVGIPNEYGELDNISGSPLQAILAYATLSNAGIRPAPRIALAVNTPVQGWVILSATTKPVIVMEPEISLKLGELLHVTNQPLWQTVSVTREERKYFTWYAAGTIQNWQGTKLTIIVLLEENNAPLASFVGRNIIFDAMKP